MLNQLKRHPRSHGSLRSRPSEQEREREREGRGGERESRPDQGLSFSLALLVEYGEDPGNKVADTNCLRNGLQLSNKLESKLEYTNKNHF